MYHFNLKLANRLRTFDPDFNHDEFNHNNESNNWLQELAKNYQNVFENLTSPKDLSKQNISKESINNYYINSYEKNDINMLDNDQRQYSNTKNSNDNLYYNNNSSNNYIQQDSSMYPLNSEHHESSDLINLANNFQSTFTENSNVQSNLQYCANNYQPNIQTIHSPSLKVDRSRKSSISTNENYPNINYNNINSNNNNNNNNYYNPSINVANYVTKDHYSQSTNAPIKNSSQFSYIQEKQYDSDVNQLSKSQTFPINNNSNNSIVSTNYAIAPNANIPTIYHNRNHSFIYDTSSKQVYRDNQQNCDKEAALDDENDQDSNEDDDDDDDADDGNDDDDKDEYKENKSNSNLVNPGLTKQESTSQV